MNYKAHTPIVNKFMLIILATWEAEIGRMWFQASPGKKKFASSHLN
jgi:hypothetical protein